jgi:hypothetical protein
MQKIHWQQALALLRHFFGQWQLSAFTAPKPMAMGVETPTVQTNIPPTANTPAPSEAAANLPPTPPEPPEPVTAATPPTPLTPYTWLAKQSPEDTIFIYIATASHQILELSSQPRHNVAKAFNVPMYRDQAAQWQSAGANCLMRVALEPAIERAKFEQAVEELLSLQSAREHLSSKLARLDHVIAYLYTELTQNTKDPHQAVPDLPAALWVDVLIHAKERVPMAADWELLGAFLRQRKETSAEMELVDKAFLPALASLGNNDG